MEPNATKETTGVKEWKKKGHGVPLDLPSGNVALVRPVGMQVFLEKGLIPNSLKELVVNALKAGKELELKADDFDTNQIDEMLELFNAVAVYCVVEPKVHKVPMRQVLEKDDTFSLQTIPLEDRDSELLYIDEVDFEDKAFIFQFAVGGTRSLERFREEFAAGISAISGSKNVEDSPQSTNGD